MAAKYTRLLRSIWRDEDFVALGADSQRLYMLLLSQPDISACGVLPLLIARWANLAADTDADSVRAALDPLTLGDKPFVVVDDSTLEAWVRGYLKVDELYRVPNGRKAIESALDAVVSSLLRDRIGTVYETLCGTLDGRDGSPQQPAANAKSTSNASSQHRDGQGEGSNGGDADMDAAVASIIDVMVGMRLESERNIRSPSKYAAALRRDLPIEHGSTIDRLLAQFPGAPASAVAAAVLSGDTRQLAPYTKENA